LNEDAVTEPSTPPGWQRGGWVPVAKVKWAAGWPTPRLRNRLAGAIVWSAEDASELKVLWLPGQSFRWSGLVMMRPDPRSPYRVEFETFRLDGDTAQVQRLVAVKNDPLTTVTTLLGRLRDRRYLR
jgi:hypothetical protein